MIENKKCLREKSRKHLENGADNRGRTCMKLLSHGPDGPAHSVKNQKPHKIRDFRLIEVLKISDLLCKFHSMELVE